MSLNNPQKISLLFFLTLLLFWSALFFNHVKEGVYNYLYSFLFGLTPLVGGAFIITRLKIWGGVKTDIGKAVCFIGLGIFLWGCGEMVWSYYNFFLKVPAPYPSLADIFFAPSIFLYGLGAFYLSKITGIRFGLRGKIEQITIFASLLVVFIVSYFVLVVVARGGVITSPDDNLLKVVLDIIYPLADFFDLAILAIVTSLSFKYILKGGKYTFDIMAILLGLGIMFIADSVFSYTTTVGTYYNANWGDLLLTFGTFFLTFGVLGFYDVKKVSA